MASVTIFAELESPQRVLQHIARTDLSEWVDGQTKIPFRTDVVIDADLSLLDGIVPREFWKHDPTTSTIIEWTQAEKNTKAAADAAAAAAAEAQRLVEIRSDAASGLDDFDVNPLLMRAFADIIKDEINTLRALHGLGNRTLAQLRTAITNRVNDGTVDT